MTSPKLLVADMCGQKASLLAPCTKYHPQNKLSEPWICLTGMHELSSKTCTMRSIVVVVLYLHSSSLHALLPSSHRTPSPTRHRHMLINTTTINNALINHHQESDSNESRTTVKSLQLICSIQMFHQLPRNMPKCLPNKCQTRK